MKYEQPHAGGSWDHKSLDCATHGDNVPHARPHKSSVAYQCVQCMLTAACILAERELLAARISAGTSAPEVAQNSYTPAEAEALARCMATS